MDVSADEKVKIKHMANQNKSLILKIVEICREIEETMNKSQFDVLQTESHQESKILKYDDFSSLQIQIGKYKEMSLNLKNKMEGFYNLRKVEFIENEIRKKKDNREALQNEHNALSKIYKNQKKANPNYNADDKTDLKPEAKFLQCNLKTLKDDFKYSKEIYKKTEKKIKKQFNKIVQLEEKIRKLEQIQFYVENVKNKKPHDDESECNQMEDKLKTLESQVYVEERQYKSTVVNQLERIANQSEEIERIGVERFEQDQIIRLNKLKYQEINRIAYKYSNKKLQERATSAKANLKSIRNTNNKERIVMSKTPLNVRNNRPFDIKFGNHTPNEQYIPNNKGYKTSYSPPPIINKKPFNKLPKEEDMVTKIEKLSKHMYSFF
jgi:hypothetical protein